MNKSYSEMMILKTHRERLDYLKISEIRHESPRHISNAFYKSALWKQVRARIIERDLGCDLGCIDVSIADKIIVHHINPINENDIIVGSKRLTDEDNLVCVSQDTHNYIHYGGTLTEPLRERKPNDTDLW